MRLPSDVVRVPVPTPFELIPEVNVYLLLGARPALIDVGPGFVPALTAVEAALSRHGLALHDLVLVLLTHDHIDHAGLASCVQAHSEAALAATAPVAHRLLRPLEHLDADDAFADALLRHHGFNATVAKEVRDAARAQRPFMRSAHVDVVLRPGTTVAAGDRQLVVHARPGHSPGDTVFHDPADGLLFAGDHLMATVASTAFLHCPPGVRYPAAEAQSGRRISPVHEYVESLRATAELDVSTVLAGHGPPFHAHRDLITRRLTAYDARARALLPRLREPRTVGELVGELQPSVPVSKLYLVVCELLGQLELLERGGLVRRNGERGGVRFAAAPAE